MSSSNSPCAACKFLRRKCTQECVFAPYFPPDQPQKFANVHKVFGASNVAKLLNDLNAAQREDAVNSLAYEADARLRDPVYGCVGLISILQHKLKQVQADLFNAKKELAGYIGPSAMLPILQHPGLIQQHPGNPQNVLSYNNMQPMLGLSMNQPHGAAMPLMIRDPQQQQQMLEAQQLAVAEREQQEILRTYEQQQQQQPDQHARFNNGFDTGGQVTASSGFNQAIADGSTMSLVLGSYENQYTHQIQQQQQQPQELHIHHNQVIQIQPQLLLQQHQQQQQQQIVQPQVVPQHRDGSEEGRSGGPSC